MTWGGSFVSAAYYVLVDFQPSVPIADAPGMRLLQTDEVDVADFFLLLQMFLARKIQQDWPFDK